MSRAQHYLAAEDLLAEGRMVVAKISDLKDLRDVIAADHQEVYLPPEASAKLNSITREMDEQGKKVMGIWAQAAVHAQLANADWQVSNKALEMRKYPRVALRDH
jgi:hypothetical protein